MADWLLLVPRRDASPPSPDPTVLAPRLRSPSVEGVARAEVEGASLLAVPEGCDDPGIVRPDPGSTDGPTALSSALLTEREELVRRLRAEGREASCDAPDGVLLAQAADLWGDGAWECLTGEFAAAVWWPRQRSVLLAVDGLGARTIFWADTPAGLVASTRFEAMMVAPEVARAPNREALLDYLRGTPSSPGSERTWLREVSEVRAGRSVRWWDGQVSRRTWWAFPELPLWRPRDPREAVERLRSDLRDSLRDRLRGHRRVAIALTGGMDSPPVAATAAALRDEEGLDLELTAVHAAYPPELDSPEAALAQEVADALDIPFVSVPIGDAPTWPMTLRPQPWPPHHWYGKWEPLADALAQHGTLVLNGRNGEMFSRATFTDSLVRGRVDEMVAAWRGLRSIGLPFRFWGRKAWVRKNLSASRRPTTPTPWVRAESHEGKGRGPGRGSGPRRPSRLPGRLRFLEALVSNMRRNSYQFERGDIRLPSVDPFSDRRLIHLASSITPLPWRMEKYLVRRAFENDLPPSVVTRPRAPTPWFPVRLGQEMGPERLHPLVRELVHQESWAAHAIEALPGRQAMLWLAPLVVSDWLRELEAG